MFTYIKISIFFFHFTTGSLNLASNILLRFLTALPANDSSWLFIVSPLSWYKDKAMGAQLACGLLWFLHIGYVEPTPSIRWVPCRLSSSIGAHWINSRNSEETLTTSQTDSSSVVLKQDLTKTALQTPNSGSLTDKQDVACLTKAQFFATMSDLLPNQWVLRPVNALLPLHPLIIFSHYNLNCLVYFHLQKERILRF